MLAVWEDVCIIHVFHHLSGHRLSLCDWQTVSHSSSTCVVFFPWLSNSLCPSRFFFLLQPRLHQRHAFHVDSSSGTEPQLRWQRRGAPPLLTSKVLLNVLNVVQTLRDQKAKGGKDASRMAAEEKTKDEYVVMMCIFLSLGNCSLLYLFDSIWY